MALCFSPASLRTENLAAGQVKLEENNFS